MRGRGRLEVEEGCGNRRNLVKKKWRVWERKEDFLQNGG